MRARKPKPKARPQPTTELEHEVAIVRRVLERYPEGSSLIFGAPTRCPECGDFGMVEEVARATGEATNQCRCCAIVWVITRRALKAHAASLLDTPAPVVGDGFLVDALPAPPDSADPAAERWASAITGRVGPAGPSLVFP